MFLFFNKENGTLKFVFDQQIKIHIWNVLCIEWEIAYMDNLIKMISAKELETNIKKLDPSDPTINEKTEKVNKIRNGIFKEQDVRKSVYVKVI